MALVLFAVMLTVNSRAPELAADRADIFATAPRAMMVVGAVSTMWLPTASLVIALALVVLGPFPGQEPALYLTAVGLGLFIGAISLFALVFSQGCPQTTSGPTELPATGGSSV